MSQNNGQSGKEAFYQDSMERIEREFNPDNCTITFEDDEEEEYKYVLTDLGELDHNFLKEHNLIAKWTFVAQNDTTQVTPIISREIVAGFTPEELQDHIKGKVVEHAVAILMKQNYPES